MTHRNQSLYRNVINVMELELLQPRIFVDYAIIAFRALTVTNGFCEKPLWDKRIRVELVYSMLYKSRYVARS